MTPTNRRAPQPWNLLPLLALLSLPGKARAEGEAPSPESPAFGAHVMNRIDDLYRGQSSQSEMEMQVKTRHYERTMAMESWSLGRDYSLVRILKPRKERGTATLKAKQNLFIYLNKTGRTVKITSGMMGGAWMGSHFTNDDLVRHSRLARDYTIKLAFKGRFGGVPIYRFTLTAKPDAPVVWGKLDVAVRQHDLQPLWQVFFDEAGKKVRQLVFSDHKELGGRTLPGTMTMRPLDGSGEYTRVTLKSIDFGKKLSPAFFSLQRLKASR